jgi:hypothetical protein
VQFAIDGSNFGSPVPVVTSGGISTATSAIINTLSVGTHTVTATYLGDGNYTTSSATLAGGEVVTPAAPTVTVSDAGGTYNGTAFSAGDSIRGVNGQTGSTLEGVGLSLTYYAGSSVTGTNLGANAPANAGTYTVVAAFAGSPDYSSGSASTTFTISPKAASVTPNAASKIYGSADPTLTGTVSGFLPIDNVQASFGRTAGETVLGGPYTISETLSSTGALSNYAITYNTASFTITPKAASVTPNAASKVYGSADPTLTGTLNGFLSNDNVHASFSRTAGETVAGGPYTISATLSPTGALNNYAITYNTASFAITKATPTVTVSDAGGTANGNPFPATGTVTGVSGTPGTALENVGLTFTYYLGTGTAGANLGPSAPSSAGTYTVVATFAGSADYFGASAQTTFIIKAGTASTTTSLATSGTGYFGQVMTFTATVTSSAGTPTGSVDFYDMTTLIDLGSVALVNGHASLNCITLPPGSNQITATFNANGGYLTSSNSSTVSILPSVYVLDRTAAGALTLTGNAHLQISGLLDVDSNSSSAINASGNAIVSAGSVQVVGKVATSNNAHVSPAPVTGIAAFADPLAGLAAPSLTGAVSSVNLSGNSALTINPGIYTGIAVSGNGKLTMNPGIYVIKGGGFSVTGNGSVSGAGVTIYNGGTSYPNNGGSYGAINLAGNGKIGLTPSATGTYAGILFFQPSANTSTIALSGNAISIPGGVTYAPGALLTLSGNGQAQGAFIVDAINISGNGILNALSVAGNAPVVSTPSSAACGINSLTLNGAGQSVAIVASVPSAATTRAGSSSSSPVGADLQLNALALQSILQDWNTVGSFPQAKNYGTIFQDLNEVGIDACFVNGISDEV